MTRCVEKDLNLHSSCEQQFYRLLAWPIGVQRLKIFGKYVTKKDGKADGQTHLGTIQPTDDSKIGFCPTRQSLCQKPIFAVRSAFRSNKNRYSIVKYRKKRKERIFRKSLKRNPRKTPLLKTKTFLKFFGFGSGSLSPLPLF